MATKFSNTLMADCTTDARFRANAQFVEDTLVGGGWVVTSDTGQTLPASLVHPTVANTKMGYRIYRMNDSLQGSFPVFMRIDFGSSAVLSITAFWLTIGTGSDGSGNITGMLHNGGARLQGIAGNSPATTACNAYGSAGTSRFTLGMWIFSNAAFVTVVALERSKDASGNDTGDGLLLFWSDYANGGNFTGPVFSKYLIWANAGGSQPALETGLNYVCSSNLVSDTFSPGDIGVGLPFCFKGLAQQPGMNLAMVALNDCSLEGSFQVRIYGQTITYQHLNLVSCYKALAGSLAQDTNVRVCIRYD